MISLGKKENFCLRSIARIARESRSLRRPGFARRAPRRRNDRCASLPRRWRYHSCVKDGPSNLPQKLAPAREAVSTAGFRRVELVQDFRSEHRVCRPCRKRRLQRSLLRHEPAFRSWRVLSDWRPVRQSGNARKTVPTPSRGGTAKNLKSPRNSMEKRSGSRFAESTTARTFGSTGKKWLARIRSSARFAAMNLTSRRSSKPAQKM